MRENFRLTQENAPEPTIRRDGNFAEIRNPEADYYLFYGRHDRQQDTGKFPSDLDGVFLEGAGSWTAQETIVVPDQTDNYHRLLNRLAEKGTPLYYADLGIENLDAMLWAGSGITVAETVLGMKAAGAAMRKSGSKSNAKPEEAATSRDAAESSAMSRRTFLKRTLLSGGAAYLGLPIVSSGININAVARDNNFSEVATEISKFTERVHPEIRPVILGLRNAVVSYKFKRLALSGLAEKDPSFGMVWGASHVGIEDQLTRKTLDEQLSYFKRMGPIVRAIVDPETFCRVHRFDYQEADKRWQIGERYEFPELRALVER